MIGKLLGHTQVQTTARYAHLARDTVKASAARIGDSIDSDLEIAEESSPARRSTTVLRLAGPFRQTSTRLHCFSRPIVWFQLVDH